MKFYLLFSILLTVILVEGGAILHLNSAYNKNRYERNLLEQDLAGAEKKLFEKETQIKKFKQKFEELELLTEKLTDRIKEVERTEEVFNTKIQSLQEHKKALEVQLEREREVSDKLKKTITFSEETEKRLISSIDQLLERHEKKMKDIVKSARKTIEESVPKVKEISLEKIVVEKSHIEEKAPEFVPERTVEGRILVKNPRYGFVVTNLGARNGVSVGDEFDVASENSIIGVVRITKLFDRMSVADIISLEPGKKISKGYHVSLRR